MCTFTTVCTCVVLKDTDAVRKGFKCTYEGIYILGPVSSETQYTSSVIV